MTEPSAYKTEAATVADIAYAATEPAELHPGALAHVIVPEGAESVTLDLERFADMPARRRGQVVVWDAQSFTKYVNAQMTAGTTVYTDVRGSTLAAVINGHQAPASADPGWGDHRAVLQLRHTPQWDAWNGFCGQMRNQVAFAEFIEDHLADIFEPSGAEMLELAQTFEAKTGVDFKSSTILDTGQRQLRYEETVNATASNGTLTIPKQVTLGLQPYEGSKSYRVTARFRFRINNGALTLGLILDDPVKVLETAFDDIRADVAETLDLDIPVLAGVPAVSLHPGYPR